MFMKMWVCTTVTFENSNLHHKIFLCVWWQAAVLIPKSLQVNGVNTQGENIADNGGIKEAYLAYETYEAKNGPEPRLPGLENYSPRQMFWIGYANVWCSKSRPEYLRDRTLTNVHAPAEFRVVGPLSNRPEFATDFNCPVGSPMNPEKKCSVWWWHFMILCGYGTVFFI